jgi:MFS family permease
VTDERMVADEQARRKRIAHLVLVNAFVGAMVGIERTVLPVVAESEFGVASASAALAFIATFGVTKALTNFFAGALSERWGRRPLLLLGWLFGIPVPVVLIFAPSWSWVLFANVLLGVNQSLTWSMTVVMKVDLATPRTYGLVIGWNEFAGYAGVATTALATGWIGATFGLRPEPFYLGIAIAVAGLLLSFFAKETRAPPDPGQRRGSVAGRVRTREVLARGTYLDRRLSAASLAGLATNLKDGALWGLLPVLLLARGLNIEEVGAVVALYPLIWAASQLLFGPMSDRIGRRGLIAGGLTLQGIGVAVFLLDGGIAVSFAGAFVVGLGTGMVYPTLLAFVSEWSEAGWRASALGVYRLWRDLGYAAGALGAGVIADLVGVAPALAAVASATLVAALWFGVRTGGRT